MRTFRPLGQIAQIEFPTDEDFRLLGHLSQIEFPTGTDFLEGTKKRSGGFTSVMK